MAAVAGETVTIHLIDVMTHDRYHESCSDVSQVPVSVGCHATCGAVEGVAACALAMR